MPDPRFYQDLGPVSLADLAELTGARTSADPALRLSGVAILAQARAGEVTFLSDKRYLPALALSQASACFVPEALAAQVPQGCAALITPRPQAAYALAAHRLHQPRRHDGPKAVSPDAALEEGVRLAPGVVVGPGAQIGRGSVIGANTVIGPGVAIGRDCELGPGVVVGFALIGDRVKIYAGAVVGEAGFGATAGPRGVMDIPQLGRVIVQDGVTIGANSTVDRGAYEDTVIGENTKIDNLVHIAHNARVGRNCVMAAYTGISGSVEIGDGAAFGGRAGVADHLTIGAGAQIGAAAGVFKNVPAGETWTGYPARPLKKWLRETAWLSKSARRRDGADQ